MTELVSMPTEIIPHLRETIEKIDEEAEADFAIYHLGIEWGRKTVRISGERCERDELDTKAVLAAVHSGVTNLEVEVGDVIKVTPLESNIDDKHFLSGFVAGIISELLDEYHIAKIVGDHFEVVRWDSPIDDQVPKEEIEGLESEDFVELDRLNRCESYLVKDEEGKAPLTFETFFNALEEGMPGLCMTKLFPSKIEERYSEKDFSAYWLSELNSTSEVNVITPEKFSEVVVKIANSFYRVKHGVFMLHGLGYLMDHAEPKEVVNAIQTVKDLTALGDGIFLVAVDEETIDPKWFNILKSDLNWLEE